MAYRAGHYRGDYLYARGDYGYSRRMRGDPFLGKLIKGAVGVVTRVAGAVLPGPAGMIARAITQPKGTRVPYFPPEPSIASPFGPEVQAPPGMKINGAGQLVRKRRRINPTNPMALRRSIRRIDGFIRLVRRSLKHTPYTLSRKGGRRDGGSPGVITRSEAARALRA